MEQRRTFYRAHLILHNFAITEVQRFCFFGGLSVGSISAVSLLFVGIKFSQELNTFIQFLLTCMGILIIWTLKTFFHLANVVTENSVEYKLSYFRSNLHLSRYDIRFLKSCPIIQPKVLGLFTMSTESFKTLVGNLIIKSTIDLLLTFRN